MANKQRYNKNIILGLDIETTSFHSNRISAYDEQIQTSNTCYLWGVGVYDFVDVLEANFIERYNQKSLARQYKPFRTFEEVDEYFRSFTNADIKTICLVHNLGYESAFICSNYIAKYGYKELFEMDEHGNIELSAFMGDSPRKPFRLCFKKWQGVEFRCSLKLLNDSLERVGKKFKFEKLKELKTYKELYFSDSKLPLSEYQYNLRDIDVMVYAVVQTLCKNNLWNAKNVDSIASVFSSTSFIKKQIKKYLGYWHELDFVNLLKDLNPRTIEDYALIDYAYVGGYTHANARYRSMILKDVHSIDLTSAYPSIMACLKFPTKYRCGTYAEYQDKKYRCIQVGFIASVRFKCLRAKENRSGMCYIADTWRNIEYKAKNVCLNNGKIYSACDVVLIINSNQFEIIEKQYDFASVEFSNEDFLLLTNYKFLSKYYIEYIYELARTKTELKEVLKDNTLTDEERHTAEINLMKSKNGLNGQYGVQGCKVCRPQIYINDQGVHECGLSNSKKLTVLEQYQRNYYNMIIASEVTTQCHKQLFKAIDYLHDKGAYVVYCDTDSIKFFGNFDGRKACEEINRQMRRYIRNDLSKSFIQDFDFLGFDYEGKYDYARFLGAKKYLTCKDGKFSITVAGVPKYNTNKAINKYAESHTIQETFDYWLKKGTVYPSKITGKLLTRYYTKDLYYKNDEWLTDENGKLCHVKDCYGVTLYECDYILNESNYITEKWEEGQAISGKGDK